MQGNEADEYEPVKPTFANNSIGDGLWHHQLSCRDDPIGKASLLNPRPIRARVKAATEKCLERGMADVASVLCECERVFKLYQAAANITKIEGEIIWLGEPIVNDFKQWGRFARIRQVYRTKETGHIHVTYGNVLLGDATKETSNYLVIGDVIACGGRTKLRTSHDSYSMLEGKGIDMVCEFVELLRHVEPRASTNVRWTRTDNEPIP